MTIAAVCAGLLAGGAGAAARAWTRGGGDPASAGSAGVQRTAVTVGFVIKTPDNPFFVAMYEGAMTEATRLGAHLTVRSVSNVNDLTGQAQQLRALVAAKADCYVLNPSTSTNLIGALAGVRRPLVNVDSPVDRAAAQGARARIQTYVGTDDFAAGRMAGYRMVSLLPRGGAVALIGAGTSINSILRLGGFEAGIRGSQVKVTVRANADYDRTKAQIATERILQSYPRISGFFAVNDLMALGVADAVSAAGKAGQIKVIGVDGIPAALDTIQSGSMQATVSQYPYVMGQMAVEACVAAAHGAHLPGRVDAPIALLTHDNVARAIAAFPNPVTRYSDPFTRLRG